MTVLDDFVVRVSTETATIIEERIKLVVRPKPRWLPERLWRKALARMLVIEEHRR